VREIRSTARGSRPVVNSRGPIIIRLDYTILDVHVTSFCTLSEMLESRATQKLVGGMW